MVNSPLGPQITLKDYVMSQWTWQLWEEQLLPLPTMMSMDWRQAAIPCWIHTSDLGMYCASFEASLSHGD